MCVCCVCCVCVVCVCCVCVVCVLCVCVWQGSLWRTVQGMMFHLVGFIASGIYPCLILDTVRWDMGDN